MSGVAMVRWSVNVGNDMDRVSKTGKVVGDTEVEPRIAHNQSSNSAIGTWANKQQRPLRRHQPMIAQSDVTGMLASRTSVK